MKRCTTCGDVKPSAEFYADRRRVDGLKSQCKRCHCRTSIDSRDPAKARKSNRDHMRRARERDPEKFRRRERLAARRRQDGEKASARQQLNAAVRAGAIERPCACSRCGRADLKIEGHHDDYGRPLDVRWLCTVCHGEEHADA